MANQEQKIIEEEVVQNWDIVPLPEEEKDVEKTIQVGKRYTTFEHYTGIRNFDILSFDQTAEENRQFMGLCLETGERVYFNAKGLDEYKEIGGCHNSLNIETERDISEVPSGQA